MARKKQFGMSDIEAALANAGVTSDQRERIRGELEGSATPAEEPRPARGHGAASQSLPSVDL